MKNVSKTALSLALLFGVVFILSYCQQDDTIIFPEEQPLGANVLLAQKITTAPTIDGVVDGLWDKSTKLSFYSEVPDPSGDLFRGFVGNIIANVNLRAAYDANNIYFLAEWDDPTESLVRQPWYFDPTAKLWKQESANPIYTSPTRQGFYEDKIAMLWNIENSVVGWNSATCYSSCHTNLSSTDGFARHHTNSPSERIDMWHWKSVRGGVNAGQFDDQYQDNTYPNGRKSDAGDVAYSDNKQTLVVTGSMPAVSVSVPKYVILNKTNYLWILKSETTDGTALTVTAVDAEGILTLSDGSTIDPNTDVQYQRDGAGMGDKCVAGIVVGAYSGSRADITCKSTYTGTGWILEFQRALNTGDAERKDVDFSSLEDQYFGFAIFENAQIAHSIKPNLLLKFDK